MIERRSVRLPSVAFSHSRSRFWISSTFFVRMSMICTKLTTLSCWLSMFGVREVETAARIPFGTLIAVGGDAARVGDHAGEVQQVPRHERGVAVREVVRGTAGSRIQVRRTGARFT